ncbi:MAG: adenylosuccinate lyase, partial [Nanoarchaeota archaeon]|nr:adenylosuccinate lyase [Nanoarchaeota archaeon]
NICGLARIMRSNSIAAMENMVTWHERDISHSSTERIIFPDCTILMAYMINSFKNIIQNMDIHSENMKSNAEITKGLYNSQSIMLALIEKGLTREKAYELVQRNAMKCNENCNRSFQELLLRDKEIKKYLSSSEIKNNMSYRSYFKYVDYIFSKVFTV